MGSYIKKYPTETEWLSEQPSFQFPHVSYVVDINYVDFGLYEYPTAIPSDDVLTAASNPQVYAILNNNSIPHTGENDGYTADDLATITVEQLYDQNSNSIFNGSDIETFNEFAYFTVSSVPNGIFDGCSSLTSVVIPQSATDIGSSAFMGCTSLTEITIPNSVTAIGRSAFLGCSSLERVVIGLSVTSIGDQSFQSCSSLEEISALPTTAPSITQNTFSNIKRNGELKVRTGSDYSSWMSELSSYDWEITYVN